MLPHANSVTEIAPIRTPAPARRPWEVNSDVRSRSVQYGAALLVLVLLGFTVGTLLGTGRWALVSYMLGALSLCGAMYCFVIRRVGASYSPKLLFLVTAKAPAAYATFFLVTPAGTDYLIRWADALFERPLQCALGLLSVPCGIATVFALICLRGCRETPLNLPAIVDRGGDKLQLFLIFAAFVNVSFWVAVLDVGNPVFYLLRVIRSALSFAAFAAGFCAFRFKAARNAWFISLGLGLLASLLTGGRGAGFVPVGLFLLGTLFGAPTLRVRTKLIALIVPTAIALLTLAGYIHSLRDVTGRKTIQEVFEEGSILENSEDVAIEAEVQNRMSPLTRGLYRVTSWPPGVIPVMTPEVVPYRGFGDIQNEIREAFKLRIVEFAEAEGRRADLTELYSGNMALYPYGFAVSSTSSVEFGLLSDGFTRGGWGVAFLYGVIAAVILLWLESAFRKLLLPSRPAVFGIMLVVFAGFAATRFQLDPLISAARSIVLNTTLALAVFMTLDFVLNVSRSRSASGVQR